MIKVSKMADYGVALLAKMAQDPGGHNYASRDLAESTGLSLPMVSKVLKALARAGILSSQRGVKGGYSLGRTPQAISIAVIISALDGPIAITSCLNEDDSGCGIEKICNIRSYWKLINEHIVGALEAITLADIVLLK